MNDAWKRIFSDWIKSYESIEHLDKQGVVEDFKAEEMREDLLTDSSKLSIKTMVLQLYHLEKLEQKGE